LPILYGRERGQKGVAMRLLWTIGPLTIFDVTLFNIESEPTRVIESSGDVVVVHHYHDEEDEDGPSQEGPDLFGGKG
jgi:hypothetical protein